MGAPLSRLGEIRVACFTVGNNVYAGPFLVEDGNVDGVAEQFLEIVRTPIALSV